MTRRLRSIPLAVWLASAALAASPTAPASSVLPFIEDDYDKALTLAKQKKVPIFVEAWAPW